MECEWAGPRQEALQDAGWRVGGGSCTCGGVAVTSLAQ